METRLERQLVGAGTVLLHLLLVYSLLRVAAVNGAGESGGALEGNGEGMVVEFIALASADRESEPAPIPIQQNPAVSSRQEAVALQDSPSIETDPQVDRALSEIGEQIAFRNQAVAQLTNGGATLSASLGGNPADDLLANYHSALRASIRQKWKDLTSRPFPTGCTVRLDLAVGGPVNATSAYGCAIPHADRMQLEAAILMAQPLPYAGYESVFTTAFPLLL